MSFLYDKFMLSYFNKIKKKFLKSIFIHHLFEVNFNWYAYYTYYLSVKLFSI